MSHRLDAPLALLVRDFLELRARSAAFVLATIVTTAGSTYRKAGTQMLITAEAELRGLLSGGCLEVDLVEHARTVLADGRARLVAYDMRGPDDVVFGLGSGCEGAMQILLQRVGPAEAWQPLAQVAECAARSAPQVLALIVDGAAAGRGWWTGGGNAAHAEPAAVVAARRQAARDHDPVLADAIVGGATARVLALPLQPPPALLLLGAGPDAVPLARLATQLGFAVTVTDHRPALATAARRERLLAELGPAAAALAGRLRAPVGLDIGARTPEAIALAVIAEIHAWIAGRGGRPFSEALETPAS